MTSWVSPQASHDRQLLVPVTPMPSPDVRGHLELKNVDFSDLVDVAQNVAPKFEEQNPTQIFFLR